MPECRICGKPIDGVKHRQYCSFQCFRKRLVTYKTQRRETSLVASKITNYLIQQKVKGREAIPLKDLIDIARTVSGVDSVSLTLQVISDLGLEWRLS